jgi:hypothetical protein
MEVFERIELQLGKTYREWPSYILKYLFCEQLSSVNRIVLSAFFYGNNIALEDCIECIRSCVPYFGHFSDEFSIRNWYKLWRRGGIFLTLWYIALSTATKLFFFLEETEYDIEDKVEPLNKLHFFSFSVFYTAKMEYSEFLDTHILPFADIK